MNPTRWATPALAVLLVLGTGATVWWGRAGSDAARQRAMAASPPTKIDRLAAGEREVAGRSPSPRNLHSLPPRAKAALLELEGMASALQSGENVTAHDVVNAREVARELLTRLSADELEALILFYELDSIGDFALESGELFSTPLYEAWGEEAPGRAHRHITEKLRSLFEKAGGRVHLDDPFAVDPGSDLLSALFAGWAKRDPREAFAAWEETSAWMSPFIAGGTSATDEALFRSWAHTDTQGAYLHLRDATETNAFRKNDQTRGFLDGLPTSTSWSEMAAQIGRDGFDSLDPLFAARWANHDADAAVNWILTQDPNGETVPRMFSEWRREGGGDDAVQWLVAQGEKIPPAARAEIFLETAVHLPDYLDSAIAAVQSLPPSAHTWSLIDRLARDDDPFAEIPTQGVGASPARVRALLDDMHAPQEVRTRIGAILRERGEDLIDPFSSGSR